MNERITLLALKASDPKTGWLDRQKFAQLIVRECMSIARDTGNICEPDDWALDRCYEIEQKIQDRFGVEQKG